MNDTLVKLVKGLECTIAICIFIAILISIVVAVNTAWIQLMDGTFRFDDMLKDILTLVIGLEFVKMLILHTPASVMEVLLYAVARQVILSHDSALENLIGVSAIAIIFIIRQYLLDEKMNFFSLKNKAKDDQKNSEYDTITNNQGGLKK